ncbi:MAG TPA: hypothetical protein VJT49_32610 [Amycolatopsis sp.]|uniref:hypothetical protein n=1 Tax=Amycolatopsis sp. TaxID=37632 RepID=UPI002B4A0CAB|nr:hypothetical protein [Amycolatopsis sp.]HKS49766.1 hypothetical protein [Amycolatopsis sp.]
MPTPRGPVDDTVLAEGTTTYLMAGSARQDAQKKLAEFLITADAQALGTKATGTATPAVRLPVNKTVNVSTTYDDPRWQTFADNYADSSRPFPNVPDFQPFRQDTAAGLNKLFSSCGTDVQGSLDTLAGTLKNDLAKEGIAQ